MTSAISAYQLSFSPGPYDDDDEIPSPDSKKSGLYDDDSINSSDDKDFGPYDDDGGEDQ